MIMSTIERLNAVMPAPGKTDTSRAAALSIAKPASGMRRLVLLTLESFGPMTANRAAELLDMQLLSVRPRFSELRKAGMIYDTGERIVPLGASCVVKEWRLTKKGEEAADAAA